MATLGFVEYDAASPEVRAVYDDIMATRKTDWINNFWKAIAHDPATLKRTWEGIKEIMAPGALDPLTKELLYVAVCASESHLCKNPLPFHSKYSPQVCLGRGRVVDGFVLYWYWDGASTWAK